MTPEIRARMQRCNRKVISLVGFTGAGKTTAAGLLEEILGSREFRFADPVYALAESLLGEPITRQLKESKYINPVYDTTVRGALEAINGVKDIFDANIYCRSLVWRIMNDIITTSPAVVSDLRWANEYDYLQNFPYHFTIILERPESDPNLKLRSNQAVQQLITCIQGNKNVHTITNAGTITDLYNELTKVAAYKITPYFAERAAELRKVRQMP